MGIQNNLCFIIYLSLSVSASQLNGIHFGWDNKKIHAFLKILSLSSRINSSHWNSPDSSLGIPVECGTTPLQIWWGMGHRSCRTKPSEFVLNIRQRILFVRAYSEFLWEQGVVTCVFPFTESECGSPGLGFFLFFWSMTFSFHDIGKCLTTLHPQLRAPGLFGVLRFTA